MSVVFPDPFFTDERNCLAWQNPKVKIFERPNRLIGILKRHVLEFDAL